jgi:hypothetical protein
MKCRKAENAITDVITVWGERCRLRMDPHKERTEVSRKAYHSYCYPKLFPAMSKPER